MCGIAGIVHRNSSDHARWQAEVEKMIFALAHRGKEEFEFFQSSQKACHLGHRRLSIIDLSQDGLQPMSIRRVSRPGSTLAQDEWWDGRFTITFNGEIYNYLELAKELEKEGVVLTTKSDTEVLLYSYALWGAGCLSKLRGMFAFAIWDEKEQKLFVARDQFGIKPLYWFYQDGLFAFSSEIKSLLVTSFVERKVSSSALKSYLQFYSINPPQTIIEKVYSLPPGYFLELGKEGVKLSRYWSVLQIKTNEELTDLQFIREKLRSLLLESMQLTMRSDIPVGAFLSGGLDSATIVGLMGRIASKPIETFSIGFGKEGDYLSELPKAAAIAKRFGTNHHEVIIDANIFKEKFDDFICAIDQPSGDGLNSFFVSWAAAKQVNVAMSGLGGDELFLGYRYFKELERLRALQSNGLTRTVLALANRLFDRSSYARSFFYRVGLSFLNHSYDSGLERYIRQRSLVEQFYAPNIELKEIFENEPDEFNALSKAEIYWYMAGMLLRDGDATAMHHTLEVRFPFLDKELVEFLLSVPSRLKMQGKGNKPLLANLFDDLLPPEILTLPKKGFEMPVGFWLESKMASHVDELQNIKWLEKGLIAKLQSNFRRNPKNYLKVWSLLVAKSWIEKYKVQPHEDNSLYSSWQGDRRSSSEPTLLG